MFRFQIFDIRTGDPEGHPYLHIGRALMRMQEWNIYAGHPQFSMKPVRSRA